MASVLSEPFLNVQDGVCTVAGHWNVAALAKHAEVAKRRRLLKRVPDDARWQLDEAAQLDTLGAQLLWERWGYALPSSLTLTSAQRSLFEMLPAKTESVPKPPFDPLSWLVSLGRGVLTLSHNGLMLLVMLGRLAIDLVAFIARPLRGPWKEVSAQIFHAGAQALGITALVGFLIGVVISYLSAQQLAMFGAGQFIVTLLGVSIVRELGPVLAAILVAGRSGSAITAQIGVMRVTQELDAMEVMGISQSQRLVLPRVLALALVMPLLTLWTDAMAMYGGMLAAKYELGLQVTWFFSQLPNAIGLKNLWIGLVKAMTFGIWIALVACHFGLQIAPNTESLGKGTTTSVVVSITGVILIDAIYAVIFSRMGI